MIDQELLDILVCPETKQPLRVADDIVEVAGEPFELRGRIDRIDLNEVTGERQILDYKTGDSGSEPDKTHRTGPRDAKQWVDLQLPLYRHLARACGIEGPVGLGYIVLPKAAGGTGAMLAGWDDEELAEADAAAAWVVEQINRGVFYPPSEAVAFDQFAAICGTVIRGLRDDEADEGEGEP